MFLTNNTQVYSNLQATFYKQYLHILRGRMDFCARYLYLNPSSGIYQLEDMGQFLKIYVSYW